MLALPIHGYSKYSTTEILLAYAYILMAYLSIIICYLSFLYEKNSSLVDREADRSSIDALSSRSDVRMLREDNANANSVHNQSINDAALGLQVNRIRDEIRDIRNEIRRMGSISEPQSSSITPLSSHLSSSSIDESYSERRIRLRNYQANNSQRFKDAYKQTTVEECKTEDCAICLGSLDTPDKTIVSLKCDIRHAFHQECIDEWLKRKGV